MVLECSHGNYHHRHTQAQQQARECAGFDRAQAEAVVRAIAEAQDELITRKDLEIALAPLKTDLALLKWGVGLVIAGVAAQIMKAFFG